MIRLASPISALLCTLCGHLLATSPPIVDLSQDTQRHVIIAQGTEKVYQGHPTTLLMPDGKTMFCVWTHGHGGTAGPLKRSDDGGLTWSEELPVPENWWQVKNCPAIYRLTDPQGVARLIVYAGQGPDGTMQQSVSTDEGRTWSPMRSNGLVCVMPFCTIVPADGGKKLIGLTNIRRPGETREPRSNIITQSESTDGGLTWSPWRILLDLGDMKPCEPELVRSPDGKQLLCLIRENVRTEPARYMTSDDEGRTWSEHRALPPGLHGDRHKHIYLPDGRLVIAFRDMGKDSPTRNHFVAWVGRYENILSGSDGEYKIKLLHSHKRSDCGYPGLELLPDGTLVATTYIKYRPGAEQNSVVSTRFTLAETDKAEKWTGGTLARKTAGIVLDDDKAKFTGAWKTSERHTPLVGTAYRHDDRTKKSASVATFTPEIPADGRYEVRLLYVEASNRAQTTRITIHSAEGETVVTQNQREACLEDGIPRSLGVFAFAKGKSGRIEVSNAGADGHVVVDGLQLVPEAEATAERNTRADAGFPMNTSAAPAPVKIPPPMLLKSAATPEDVNGKSYDLVVIGGTPGGIACAVRAAREGLSVLLVNHTQHLGGFVTSGAGGWEAPYDGLRSPIYAEMLTGAAQYYAKTYGEGSPQHIVSMPSQASRAHIDRPKIEPRIAEMLFNEMVAKEKTLTVLLGHIVTKAEREGALIKNVTLKPMHGESAITVSGQIFADAMYEGDLMAAAGVKTQIGRESHAQYGEKHAGLIRTKERHREPGQRGFSKDADEGRLNLRTFNHATADIIEGPRSGEADGSVMAYNYRLILTRDPANLIPVTKPANYDPALAKGPAGLSIVPNLPNGKIAWNGGRLIGPQNEYPGGDWATRERVSRHYLDTMLMRLWWVQNDPEAAAGDRKTFAGYGLAADEFPDNGHLPYEIYVREARRLVGRYVFKEQDNVIAEGIARTPIHANSIAMTDWPMDSVACLPGDGIFFLAEESRPAQVPYRSILANEVENLLVPVAISASHVGWGSIRLEPVWMQLGESAGHAAALAVKAQTTPAALDPDVLIRKLATSRMMITFFNDVDVTRDDPRVPAAQYFGTKGFFAGYDAKLDEPLTESVRRAWGEGLSALRGGNLDPMEFARRVRRAEEEDSPKLERSRGEAMLSMWRALAENKSAHAPAKAPPPPGNDTAQAKAQPRVPLKVEPLRSSPAAEVAGKNYDLVVIGGTPSGIACAVRAAREGLSVLLVQHNRHIGGMLANGLMQWDAIYGGPRSPVFNEYAGMIESYYRKTYGEDSSQYQQARYTQTHYPMSRFECGVAEHLFNQFVSREKDITTLLSHYPSAIERDGAILKTLTLREYGTTRDLTVTAATYVDATYEGDLAALAKVPYRVGREALEEYGEPHAGKVFTNISPKSGPQDAMDGKLNLHLYGHSQGTINPNSPHTADGAIQGFNYRFCLSSEEGNIRLPDKPPGYNREEYVGYYRLGISAGKLNGKALFNNALLPGENHAYPEASWPEREKIIERHRNFALGMIYFLQNDESRKPASHASARRIGLPLDEFPDNSNIPYEMYVREARRIVGRHVFTELDNRPVPGLVRPPIQSDSVALTDWPMDSHDCTWDRSPGYEYDGKLILTEESRPAQIPWRSLLPRGVDNLIVPVCLSATHVAWGAVRLEPVWMMTGEAAGAAAVLAKKHQTKAGKLDPDLLLRTLCKNRHFVSFFNDLQAAADHPAMPAAQYFGTKGFFASYDAKLDAPLTEAVRSVWLDGFKQLQQGTLDAAKLAHAVHAAESKDSPATGELRADALLRLWKQLINHP
jgi:2-polyprenyl-6-methoxyphenol hydroxylase-like FAD-dependent oxidoreductase